MYIQQRDLLRGMDKQFIKQLLDISVRENHEQGAFIFHRGDKAKNFYILLKGCIQLNMGDLGHVIHVVDHPGESFGWSSLVGREFYSASAGCILPAKVIRLDREKCFEILARNADSGMIVFQRLASLLGERLIMNYEQMSHVSHEDIVSSYGSGQLIEKNIM